MRRRSNLLLVLCLLLFIPSWTHAQISTLANRNLEGLTIAAGALAVDVTRWGGAVVTGGAGVVAAGTPRVTLASNDPAVTALEIMDDWDEVDRAKVNTIAGQVGVQGGSGIATALTQRMVLATDVALPTGANIIGRVGIDQTTPGTTNAVAVITGQNGIAGGTGVDGATVPRVSLATNVALPAGTNVLGALSANQSVNVSQINGVTPLMGNGNTGTGSHRVTNADNDPCQTSGRSKSAVSVALAATGAAEIVALSAGQVIYVCGFTLTISGTTTPGFRFEYGTGTNCATGNTPATGVFGGGTQAAAGLLVSSGGSMMQTSTAGSNALCINPSGTAPSIQGNVTYVRQ